MTTTGSADPGSWAALGGGPEEHLRFEVLDLLYRASGGSLEVALNVGPLMRGLGIWHRERRAIDWLARHGLIRYCPVRSVVLLTSDGAGLVERQGRVWPDAR